MGLDAVMTRCAAVGSAGYGVPHKRAMLCQWARGRGAFTMREAMRAHGFTLKQADNALRMAIARGDIVVLGAVRQAGCKRPVALYGTPATHPMHALGAAMAGWVRPTALCVSASAAALG